MRMLRKAGHPELSRIMISYVRVGVFKTSLFVILDCTLFPGGLMQTVGDDGISMH